MATARGSETVRLSPRSVDKLCQATLEAIATPPDLAGIVARSLLEANLAGHDSHGVMRLPSYVSMVESGQIHVASRPRLISNRGAVAAVDGCWGWGQPAAQEATQLAIGLARRNGVGVVGIRNCNHIGRLGEYVELIANVGMVGMAMCNAGPAVAPFGGRTRVLGTNPFAFAAPRGGGMPPVMGDFSTAAVAEGKLRVAIDRGEFLRVAGVIDNLGQASTDPSAFYNGGALLPFGGHKGSGLSVMIEILGGILAGGETATSPTYRNENGTMIVAFNIPDFVTSDAFAEQIDILCRSINAASPVEDGTPVLVPGQPEAVSRAARLETGVMLPTQTYLDLQALAQKLGLDWDHVVGE